MVMVLISLHQSSSTNQTFQNCPWRIQERVDFQGHEGQTDPHTLTQLTQCFDAAIGSVPPMTKSFKIRHTLF